MERNVQIQAMQKLGCYYEAIYWIPKQVFMNMFDNTHIHKRTYPPEKFLSGVPQSLLMLKQTPPDITLVTVAYLLSSVTTRNIHTSLLQQTLVHMLFVSTAKKGYACTVPL